MQSVISVENISKQYVIGRRKDESFLTLRDEICSFFGKAKSLFNRTSLQHYGSSEEFWALKDISFQAWQGDRIGIIGKNGAGKSTLLKILSRITEPTSGRISLRGRVASLLEVGTGFHPELTGRENIFLNGAILGMSRAEIKTKFDEIVAFAEVERFLDTPVKRYSSGMYVRLAFSVAAHLEPEILIVDEVLAVGDLQFQKKCLGKMQQVGNEGRTVLFVSHNMGTIRALCNKGLYLIEGNIHKTGSIEEVISAYTLHHASNKGIVTFGQQNTDFVARILSIGVISAGYTNYADTLPFQAPFTVEVIIESNNELEAVVGIGISNSIGEIITTLHSVEIGEEPTIEKLKNLKFKKGINKFYLNINSNILRPGTYIIGCTIFSRSLWQAFDDKPNCITFEVTNHNENRYFDERQSGMVFLSDSQWENR
ncbi:polysaccharide ABC transporter ATP-binding protein [Geomobilimonas luticola]|uniref:ATP-binding cassette domain-containing protein n=1 Tax=Geomobilimonas luticola TaxID=1114878 RepID=A0ABS5SCB1_9BACT|nr:polysaccharide ABC transporter ATP-binding protein [Geomobilimonas luticola]MBT0653020.1 ATP-binding cassette domain-containing protein [Geomobilimonas luticola]